MMKVMSHDLGRKLIRKLGIPGDVKKLDIQFEAGKPVTIEVEVEVTDRMGRVIDSVFEGYTVEKKDKEPEKEIVNLLDTYEAEQRQEQGVDLDILKEKTYPPKENSTIDLDPATFYTTPGVFIDQEHGIRVREKEGGELKSLEQTMIDAGLATPETLVRKILGPLTPCPIDSSHTHHVQGSECSECRKIRQHRLNNLV